MGIVTLYIAVSVDGFIAGPRGQVDWLLGDGSEPDAPGSYPGFWKSVDAVVMGGTTYRQIVTELSPDVWPYEGRPCYVATHRNEAPRNGVFFRDGDLPALVKQLKAERTGTIWICGGADVAGQLLKSGRIDRLWLSVIPSVLGGGVRLCPELPRELPLKLLKTEHANGIVDLLYELR